MCLTFIADAVVDAVDDMLCPSPLVVLFSPSLSLSLLPPSFLSLSLFVFHALVILAYDRSLPSSFLRFLRTVLCCTASLQTDRQQEDAIFLIFLFVRLSN